MTVVKICGITELDQACCALDAGADLLGFVLAPSRRQISMEIATELVAQARLRFPPEQRAWLAVGVFANQPLQFVQSAAAQAGLDWVQLSGKEQPEYCRRLALPILKSVHMPAPGHEDEDSADPQWMDRQLAALKETYAPARLLLDSGGAGRWGGTGVPFSWAAVGSQARGCMVAGGLSPDNVAMAVERMHPWGVDVSSGVERNGRKDPQLIAQFIHRAKGGDQSGNVG